jgi:hypothetical protein
LKKDFSEEKVNKEIFRRMIKKKVGLFRMKMACKEFKSVNDWCDTLNKERDLLLKTKDKKNRNKNKKRSQGLWVQKSCCI